MFKFLNITLLLILSLNTAFSVPAFPKNQIPVESESLSPWGLHILDFLHLINIEQMLAVAIPYIEDPEVLNFVSFLISSDFKEVIWEFESILEFKEAVVFLESKGYDVIAVVQFINQFLILPPFEFARILPRTGKGMSGLIQDLVNTLPLEEMKQLFENKLEHCPEVAQLFETINSKEFINILKRMSQDPKFLKISEVFKDLGFDFDVVCDLAKNIFGDYYQGIFCE